MENPALYGQRSLDGVPTLIAGQSKNDTRLILDGQQRLKSCYRAFFNNTGVDRYAGRYYFDCRGFLKNPELRNSDVEEIVLFINEDVNKLLSDTAKETRPWFVSIRYYFAGTARYKL
jgi:hypothetical protein